MPLVAYVLPNVLKLVPSEFLLHHSLTSLGVVTGVNYISLLFLFAFPSLELRLPQKTENTQMHWPCL